MDAVDTVSPLENRSDGLPHRRSIKVPGPASHPAAQQPRAVARATERDQDSVIPKEYAVVVPDLLRQGSLGNSQMVTPQPNETAAARSSQRRKRSAPATAERFWLLNRWQGQVLTVGPETFQAQLFDPAHPSVIERAEFLHQRIVR
jgi:hypothetical protein